MRSIKSVFYVPTLLKSLLAAIAVCSTWIIILFAIGITRVEGDVENYLVAHVEDLELALNQGDIISIQTIFAGLQSYGVQSSLFNTKIFANGKRRLINSGRLTDGLFSKSINIKLKNNGLTLGSVLYRLNFVEILYRVFLYDLHILAMILISNLLIFIGFNSLVKSEMAILNRALVTSITDVTNVDKLIKERNLISRLVLSEDFGRTIKSLISEVAQLRKIEIDRSALDVEKALARQIAHDIRSPLSAINLIVGKISGSPEVLDLLQRSISRISTLAEDLLLKGKKLKSPPLTKQNINPQVSNYHLETVLEKIGHLVNEFRFRFPVVDITFVQPQTKDENITVDLNILVRVLSILLENSIESLKGDHSFVRIYSSLNYKNFNLNVEDSGVGIDHDTLARLGNEIVTNGKSNGNGLGLYYAHQAIGAMGGSLKIISNLEVGTSAQLSFKLASSEAVEAKTII